MIELSKHMYQTSKFNQKPIIIDPSNNLNIISINFNPHNKNSNIFNSS